MRKFLPILAVAACLCFSFPCFAKTVKGSLEADNIRYNVNTKQAYAEGNVAFKRGEDELKGSKASGNVDKTVTILGSPVRGAFPSRDAKLTAQKVAWTADTAGKGNGTVECFGNVHITNGAANFLRAAYVKASVDGKIYEASGNVEALFNERYVKAKEIIRREDRFSASELIRFEDRNRKYALSTKAVNGTLDSKDELLNAVANGNVIFDYADNSGLKSRVTGDNAIYSREKGTLTVTGNACAIREDGKSVKADRLVYNEGTRQIDAIGNSKVIFITEEGNKPGNKEEKRGQ